MNDLRTLVRPLIQKLEPYSSARDEFGDAREGKVFLDANESPYESGINRYPDPYQRELKREISRIKAVAVENIFLGNGSDEVLDLLFRVFCEPGADAVITVPPTYGMYAVLAGINGVKNIKVPLTSDYQLDINALTAAYTDHTKLLFLCSPNNPSGTVLKREDVLKVLDSFSGIVVIDEAYVDFTTQDSWSQMLQQYPKLVVTQTLSKAYGMAGIRLGICFAQQEVIQYLNRIKPPYNVNILTQQRALERLQAFDEVQEEILEIINQRDYLSLRLSNLNMVKAIIPSQANFILARMDDANHRYQQLLKNDIIVRNRSKQLHCESTLRFTVGTKAENDLLIKTLLKLDSDG